MNPLVQRTNGSWYHLLVRSLVGALIALRSGGAGSEASSRCAIGHQPRGSRV